MTRINREMVQIFFSDLRRVFNFFVKPASYIMIH
ncbi:hypothetical protein LINGRAHAP2_LOCUS3106 [Linum grandiflorum]